MVERLGKGATTGENELHRNEYFKGSENPFIFEQFYDLNLRCNFDFTYYPFDQQLCGIEVGKFLKLYCSDQFIYIMLS